MEYNVEKIKKIINLSLDLYEINNSINSTIIYLYYDLETLENYLKLAKEFPKEILFNNKNLEEMIQRSINLIEKAIDYYNEGEFDLKEKSLRGKFDWTQFLDKKD